MAEKSKVELDRQGYPVDMTRAIVVDDEGVHTELSMTDKIGDKFVNVPTIWNGKRYDPDSEEGYRAIMKHVDEAKARGWKFPEFNSVETAVAAAKDRSEYINTLRGEDLRAAEKQMWDEEAGKRTKR